MPTLKLTERMLQRLRPAHREEYTDARTPGLLVRVAPGGASRVFYCRYRTWSGLRRKMKLGVHPSLSLADARKEALRVLREVWKGGDPASGQKTRDEERRRIRMQPFDVLAQEYLERHAKVRKRTWREDSRILETEILPVLGGRPAGEIDRQDVIALLDGIAGRAPIMANRTRALLSKLFAFGISRGLLESSPVQLVERPALERSRMRVLREDELRAIWQALEGMPVRVAGTVRLLILTAARLREVHSMSWRDIEGDWWTIPESASKNRRPHRVFLAPQSRAVLDQLERVTGSSPWVFASERKPGRHIGTVHKFWDRVVARSGVKDVRRHDLRRTVASMMTAMGISRFVVGRILNHAEVGVTGIYDRHSYDEEKREAWLLWGERVETLTSMPED